MSPTWLTWRGNNNQHRGIVCPFDKHFPTKGISLIASMTDNLISVPLRGCAPRLYAIYVDHQLEHAVEERERETPPNNVIRPSFIHQNRGRAARVITKRTETRKNGRLKIASHYVLSYYRCNANRQGKRETLFGGPCEAA